LAVYLEVGIQIQLTGWLVARERKKPIITNTHAG